MSAVESVSNFFLSPFSHIIPIIVPELVMQASQKYICEYLHLPREQNPCSAMSLLTQAKVRLMMLTQVILSLIAIPVISAVGLLSAILNFDVDPSSTLFESWKAIKNHVIVFIPTSAVGVFASYITTAKLYFAQIECFEQLNLSILIPD